MLILDQKAVDCKLRTRLDILQPYHITLQRIRLSHDIKKFNQGNISLVKLINFNITNQYIYIERNSFKQERIINLSLYFHRVHWLS